jgi:hypothetical protein
MVNHDKRTQLKNIISLNKGRTMTVQAQESPDKATAETDMSEVIGTVLLKSGSFVNVKLDYLSQFLKDNRDQVVLQKHPEMGKRRVKTSAANFY